MIQTWNGIKTDKQIKTMERACAPKRFSAQACSKVLTLNPVLSLLSFIRGYRFNRAALP
jgi:hypothetical protein